MKEKETEYFFLCGQLSDTHRLAAALAEGLWPGSVLALEGDLGSGKTAFAQGLAKALGVKETVNSPTFTIVKEYEGSRFPFYHMDVYRITPEEAEDLGLDEYFYGDGVSVVEWSGLIADLLPREHLSLSIEDLGGTQRRIRLLPRGDRYEQLCRQLKENGVIG